MMVQERLLETLLFRPAVTDILTTERDTPSHRRFEEEVQKSSRNDEAGSDIEKGSGSLAMDDGDRGAPAEGVTPTCPSAGHPFSSAARGEGGTDAMDVDGVQNDRPSRMRDTRGVQGTPKTSTVPTGSSGTGEMPGAIQLVACMLDGALKVTRVVRVSGWQVIRMNATSRIGPSLFSAGYHQPVPQHPNQWASFEMTMLRAFHVRQHFGMSCQRNMTVLHHCVPAFVAPRPFPLAHLQYVSHDTDLHPHEEASTPADSTTAGKNAAVMKVARSSKVSDTAVLSRVLLSIDKALCSADLLEVGLSDDPDLDFLSKVIPAWLLRHSLFKSSAFRAHAKLMLECGAKIDEISLIATNKFVSGECERTKSARSFAGTAKP